MKSRWDYLEEIYEKDQNTNAYIISVALDRYSDVFSEWDPAPFKKRDLDYDLRKYLESCSLDIPLKCDIILSFNILENVHNKESEERIKAGLKTYFSFNLHSLRNKRKLARERSVLFGILSLLLLFTAVSLSSFASINSIYLVMIEGIYIGGWVFLWEAISTVFLRNREVKSEYLHYKRFSNSQIRFNYVAAHS